MSIKNFFALLFILSLSTFLVFRFYPTLLNFEQETEVVHNKKTDIVQKPMRSALSIETNFESNDNFILLTSLISSILSFFGFVISSYQSMRSSRQEEELFNLKRERERLEMEKIQEEIRALAEGKI